MMTQFTDVLQLGAGYDMAIYYMILLTVLQWLRQSINLSLKSRKNPPYIRLADSLSERGIDSWWLI